MTHLDFLIIGAQKAATSSLHQSLRATAGVWMPSGESAWFEDPEFAIKPWQELEAETGLRLGIKRPDLLCRLPLIERVRDSHPDAKFVVVLRDPVARAVSAYYHLMRHAHLQVRSLDDGLAYCLDQHDSIEADNAANSVVRFGLYGSYLQEWFVRYSADRFLVLSQAAVRDDLPGVLERCRTHIGVVGVVRPQDAQQENVGNYDSRYLRVYRRGHMIKTRAIVGSDRRIVRPNRLLRAVGVGLTGAASSLSDNSRRPPPLGPDVLAALSEVYASDLEVLRDLVPMEAVDWTI